MDHTINEAQQTPARSHISPFERIRQADSEHECCSSRDLADVLGYTQWRNFEQAVSGAFHAILRDD